MASSRTDEGWNVEFDGKWRAANESERPINKIGIFKEEIRRHAWLSDEELNR